MDTKIETDVQDKLSDMIEESKIGKVFHMRCLHLFEPYFLVKKKKIKQIIYQQGNQINLRQGQVGIRRYQEQAFCTERQAQLFVRLLQKDQGLHNILPILSPLRFLSNFFLFYSSFKPTARIGFDHRKSKLG